MTGRAWSISALRSLPGEARCGSLRRRLSARGLISQSADNDPSETEHSIIRISIIAPWNTEIGHDPLRSKQFYGYPSKAYPPRLSESRQRAVPDYVDCRC